MSELTNAQGLDAVVAARLRNGGIRTTDELLEAGATASGRRRISARCGIDEGHLLEIVSQLDLMRVAGVEREYAVLLRAAGVETVADLAPRNVTNLNARVFYHNGPGRGVRVGPASTRVADWVRRASALQPVVTD